MGYNRYVGFGGHIKRRASLGLIALAAALALGTVPAADALPGQPDPTFAPAAPDFGTAPSGPAAQAGAVQPDGKILVGAVYQGSVLVFRFEPGGALDPTWGDGGIARVPGMASIGVIRPYADGRVLLASGVVERLLPDGSVDPSFGGGSGSVSPAEGQVHDAELMPDGGAVLQLSRSYETNCYKGFCTTVHLHRLLRIDANGNRVAAFGGGDGLTDELDGSPYGIAVEPGGGVIDCGSDGLRRYYGDGSPDSSFGFGGRAKAPTFFYDPVISSDGAILAVGDGAHPVVRFSSGGIFQSLYAQPTPGITPRTLTPGPSGSVYVGGPSAASAAVARYNASGQPDTSFGGGDGIAVSPISDYRFGPVTGSDDIKAVAVGPGGRVLAIGQGAGVMGVVAFDSAGTPDTSIGPNGVLIYNFRGPSYAQASLALAQPDGGVVVAGVTSASETSEMRLRIALVRYLRSGAPDSAFGNGSRVIVELGGLHAGEQTPLAIAATADGGFVLLGRRFERIGGLPVAEAVLLRYLPDGSLDPAFGSGGMAFPALQDASALLVQPDGAIVVGNATRLERFLPGGARDPNFVSSPDPSPPPYRPIPGRPALHQTADGRFLLASGWDVTRFHSDGSVDTSFGGGTVEVPGSETLADVRIDKEGGVLALAIDQRNLILNRFEANGRPDLSFGKKSRKVLTLYQTFYDTIGAATFTSYGRILGAGMSGRGLIVLRLQPDGRADPSWHAQQSPLIAQGTLGLAIAPDDDIVLAGSTYPYPAFTARIGVARFEGGGPPPISCGSRWATVVGTDGPDRIVGTSGTDVIVGLGGNDRISGLSDYDWICGGTGADILKGGAWNDHVYGQAGNDRLFGGPGVDQLNGGPGRDVLRYGQGRDRIRRR